MKNMLKNDIWNSNRDINVQILSDAINFSLIQRSIQTLNVTTPHGAYLH